VPAQLQNVSPDSYRRAARDECMLRSSALLGLSEPITAGPVLVQQPAAAKRTNNFDIVRLSLALIVVVSHCCYLSGSPSLAGISLRLDPSPAVQGFFAISGYLIFASYERCRTIREYAVHRALRILPGYYLSTVVCLAIAFAVGSHAIGKFLLANLTFMNFLHPNIPGVFDSNPGNNAMNGAKSRFCSISPSPSSSGLLGAGTATRC